MSLFHVFCLSYFVLGRFFHPPISRCSILDLTTLFGYFFQLLFFVFPSFLWNIELIWFVVGSGSGGSTGGYIYFQVPSF